VTFGETAIALLAMTTPVSRSGLLLGLLALGSLALSGLTFFELIRPFRDNHIDQPIAAGCGVLSACLSSGALSFRKGARALNVTALILSLLALSAEAVIFEALSHMKIM
jgi:hypothetical protein